MAIHLKQLSCLSLSKSLGLAEYIFILLFFILYRFQPPISQIYSKELAKLCPADLQRVPRGEAHTARKKGLVLIERETLNKQHAFMNIPKVQSVL